VENLTLIGTALNGTGNTLANRITGTAAANTLNGGSGNDTLNGGSGSDTMSGGTGNDTYLVNAAADRVVEALNAGTDTVQSTATYTLASNVERLTLTGSGNINGSGNSLNNVLTGNTGANLLRGSSGNDTLNGGTGNDTLSGGTGNDTLVGGGGNDLFRFDAALSAGNVDRLSDFNAVADGIQLENAIFTAIGPVGALAGSAFRAGTAATTAAHRVIYDQATGTLSYDADGSGAGAAVVFAQLTAGTALTAADFFVV
jgi:serralysin